MREGVEVRVEEVAFEAFGVAVAVILEHACEPERCGFPDLRAEVAALLPPGARPPASGTPVSARFRVRCWGRVLRLRRIGRPARSFRRAAPCLHALDGAIRAVVAQRAPGLVFVHAGAVAVDGSAIVVPGRSMAGKTTLVSALVRAGASYLSDEYAVLDPDGLVHPYPRRLSVRSATGRREVPVAELGGTAAEGPLPIGLVAAVEFQADATWSTTATAGPGACAMALVANAVAARRRSEEVLHAAAAVARTARFVAGARGEADDAAGRLIDLTRPVDTVTS